MKQNIEIMSMTSMDIYHIEAEEERRKKEGWKLVEKGVDGRVETYAEPEGVDVYRLVMSRPVKKDGYDADVVIVDEMYGREVETNDASDECVHES